MNIIYDHAPEAPRNDAEPASFTISGQRDRMRQVFNAWLKRPTHPDVCQALHILMTDYELAARLRSVIPRPAPANEAN